MSKKTESVKVWLTERQLLDLTRAAHRDDRKLSDYISHVLALHLYGHARSDCEREEGSMRDD